MGNLFNAIENPKLIRNKRTASGGLNPRVVTARNALKEQRAMYGDLVHTVRRLTKAEIAAQYPPERVEKLLAEAKDNLKRMQGPLPDGTTERMLMGL